MVYNDASRLSISTESTIEVLEYLNRLTYKDIEDIVSLEIDIIRPLFHYGGNGSLEDCRRMHNAKQQFQRQIDNIKKSRLNELADLINLSNQRTIILVNPRNVDRQFTESIKTIIREDFKYGGTIL